MNRVIEINLHVSACTLFMENIVRTNGRVKNETKWEKRIIHFNNVSFFGDIKLRVYLLLLSLSLSL